MAGFKKIGKELHVAVLSTEHPDTQAELEHLGKDYRVITYLASHQSLEKAWSRYEDVRLTEQATGGMVDISPSSLADIAEQIQGHDDIRELLREATSRKQGKTTRVIEIILGSAIALKASDVHFEPEESSVRLRLRQDGVLGDVATINRDLYQRVVSRLKIVSDLKITNVRQAQDGRFSIAYQDSEIEVRVSTVPSAYGESIVMRILDPRGLTVSFDGLGIEPKLLEILKNEIKKPNGLILTTGPTGSGKTTTLYSFLKYIYQPEIKVITIEDPIEYHLEGISQTQVDHKKGYDFLAGLRAALRQDPDTIMVGEIRDNETATIAINASLTGHMVFSTLHTNNAAGTIPRLLDLGISPDVLASGLTVSIAQRLVRKLCSDCKQSASPSDTDRRLVMRVLSGAKAYNKDLSQLADVPLDKMTVFTATGCGKCGGTGYKGRIGVFEAILMDEKLQDILETSPSERDVWRASQGQGLLTMAEDGVIKLLTGITSMEELKKVVDIEGYLALFNDSETYTPSTLAKQDESQAESAVAIPITSAAADDLSAIRRREVQLLLAYLQTLVEHQKQNPTVGISEKIYLAQKSLLELLESFSPQELFATPHNDIHPGQVGNNIASALGNLAQKQNQNPEESALNDIQKIKQYIENTQNT